jgi:Gpi18-like mannosyltransferase
MIMAKYSRATWLVIACTALATILKIYCAATTWGTNDTGLFQLYGHALYEAGLEKTYEASQYYNHTPALSAVLMGLYWLSSTFALPFPLLLRLPGILADVVTTLMLWRLVSRHMPGRISVGWVCLFALNPVSFMVSGYHGNFDSVLAMFVFLAAYECYRGRVDLSAFYFALAVHVKIAPLILSPIFFFYWLNRGKGARFFVITMSLLLAVWILPLLEFPKVFIHNVFEYGSYWGIWGITYWLRMCPDPQMQFVSFYNLYPIQNEIMMALKILVVAGIMIVGWRRSRLGTDSIFGTLSYSWGIFFVLAPGVLLHYLAWPSCVMMLHARRWWLALLATNSLFLFRCYTVINHGMPWDKGLFTAALLDKWTAWSNIPWVAYIAFLGYFAVKAIREREASQASALAAQALEQSAA